MTSTFMEDCLSQEVQPEDIDDYVDRWHSSDTANQQQLHEYLGLSWEEYKRWCADPQELSSIIEKKRKTSKS